MGNSGKTWDDERENDGDARKQPETDNEQSSEYTRSIEREIRRENDTQFFLGDRRSGQHADVRHYSSRGSRYTGAT